MTYESKIHYVASHKSLIEQCMKLVTSDSTQNIKIIKDIAKNNNNLKTSYIFDYHSYLYSNLNNIDEYYDNETKRFDVDKICYNWIVVGYKNKFRIQINEHSKLLLYDYIDNRNNVAVITCFNKKLLTSYAYNFLKTMNFSFDLFIGHEDDLTMKDIETYTTKQNINLFDLRDDYSLMSFIERNRNRNEIDKKEHFLKDAIKFSYKVFTVCNIAEHYINKYKYLIWMDADLVFKTPFLYKDVLHFTKENTMMSYLTRMNGKHKQYSECGFLIFNCLHEYTKLYLENMKNMYENDLIYNEKEYHDSWIWDVVRTKYERNYDIENYPIPNDGKYHISKGNVLLHSELHNYMMHPKGEEMKKSLEKFNKFVNKKQLRLKQYYEFKKRISDLS